MMRHLVCGLALVLAVGVAVGNAQSGSAVQLDLSGDDIEVSAPTSGSGAPAQISTDIGLQILFPGGGPLQMTPSCDGLSVVVPQNSQPSLVLRGAAVSVFMNGGKYSLPASMDPLPYMLRLPKGGKVTLNPRTKTLSVSGQNAQLSRHPPLQKLPTRN